MEYVKLKESISLVVLCKAEPVYIHRKWMLERGIITHDEYEQAESKPTAIGANVSAFSIGDYISVYCDKDRFQIESSDISANKRIIDICINTLEMSKPKAYSGLGVNADMDFAFVNQDDVLRFGDTFVPLKNWGDFMETPRVGGFTIQENHQPTLSKPRKAINIQSLGAKSAQDIPSVRISVNNHYPIISFDEMKSAIDEAPAKYEAFREWYYSLFKDFFK